MRSIAVACLLASGCAHIPDGPAGNRVRVVRAVALALALSAPIAGGAGAGLMVAGARTSPSPCRQLICLDDVTIAASVSGATLIGVGVLSLLVAAILGASQLQQAATNP